MSKEAGTTINESGHQKQNGVLDSVSEPLEIGQLTIKPIDHDKEIEFQLWDYYEYISIEEAKRVIDYLTKSINAR